MASVELTDLEWQQVMAIIANTNPLLMKIGDQLRQQHEEKLRQAAIRARGNSAHAVDGSEF